MNKKLTFRPVNPTDSNWIKEFAERNWDGEPLIVRGKKYYSSSLDGIVVEDKSKIGILLYEIRNNDCEILLLEVLEKFSGIGTQLLEKLKKVAINNGCKRIYLMTTNDNLDALRFYQKRGFTICAIHLDSVKASRKLKPTIGFIGDYGIPVRDEIDLELLL